jgi:hypothetical protein
VSVHLLAFLIGLFVMPLALLACGHRLRRRGPRSQSAFWGAIIGHCVAATIAVIWGMIPPEAWTAQETMRGFFGMWSLLVFPVAGALLGAVLTRTKAANTAAPSRSAATR